MFDDDINNDQSAPAAGAPVFGQPFNLPAAQSDQPTAADANDDGHVAINLPAQVVDSDDNLLSIKQEALQQLSPLVSHLDQSAEEKFKTTMMMIQAADDQSLIKDAYAAAKLITDEKARAQALLDIVNEINYFTQQHTNKD